MVVKPRLFSSKPITLSYHLTVGQMSWGTMSLGHFVLGHFVFWGKMSWGKMSTIILQLGQYVHLQKVCAIWGKMSWGKMSLGHFVLGHFVLGAKCPWGKMSPNLSHASDRMLHAGVDIEEEMTFG